MALLHVFQGMSERNVVIAPTGGNSKRFDRGWHLLPLEDYADIIDGTDRLVSAMRGDVGIVATNSSRHLPTHCATFGVI